MKINDIEDSVKKEEIAYGLEILIVTVLEFAAAVCISAVTGYLPECIAFLIVFSSLRTYSGGYHAKNHIRCFAVLIIDIAVGAILLSYMREGFFSFISIFFSMVCVITVFVFAPAEHINHPLSNRQKKKYKKTACGIACVFAIAVTGGIAAGYYRICFATSYALFSVSVSMLAVKIKSLRGGVKYEKL